MAAEPVLSVLFLWHQHQPFYKDPLSNRYELPWVRLHATKDYYDMVALLEEFPKIRANFNLVPSLLVQLEDYAQGKAHDKFLGLTQKAAADLSFEERQFILHNFFMANWENMIDPYPRYRELLDKRGRSPWGEDYARVPAYFKEQDWRDLQVWFNLAWFDPWWRERDGFIRGLVEKGRGFTEEEKHKLLEKQYEICGLVAMKHRQMMERGQIEITATPFYHPILPLLCDTEASRMAMPHVNLPHQRFQHHEDAKAQIERALADHEKRFGRKPRGMWPSEGSVSEQAAELMMEAGVEWAATDEAVLAKSLQPDPFSRDDIYEPYQFQRGSKNLNFFFRDHELSDAIGFVYAGWNSHDAVEDFIRRLHGIRERLKVRDGAHPRPHVASVILDGENCWEYYKQDGLPFLRELYQRLSEEPLLQTVCGSAYLDEVKELRHLPRLWSGSWIDANFSIWIGHHEDNQAWDFLYRTRQFLVQYLESHPEAAGSPQAQLAWDEIYIAEGSDWCWWYGDDHSSANDETFDYLFRKHLMNVYTVLGSKIPDDLHIPIKIKRVVSAVKPPVDFVTPQIDGRVTSYFEWQAAGSYQTEAGATGTMHRAQNLVKAIYFGFDLNNLYFRLDLSHPIDPESLKTTGLRIRFLQPEGLEVLGEIQADKSFKLTLINKKPGQEDKLAELPPGSALKIIEFAVPLKHVSLDAKQPLEVILLVEKDGLEQERWPADLPIQIPHPAADTFAESWVI